MCYITNLVPELKCATEEFDDRGPVIRLKNWRVVPSYPLKLVLHFKFLSCVLKVKI